MTRTMALDSSFACPVAVEVATPRPARSSRRSIPTWTNRIEDRQFVSMDEAYGRHGGLVGGEEITRLIRKRSDQPISKVARWIVTRTIVSFQWHAQTLVPLFQFDLSNMSLRLGCCQVVRELSGVFTDWDLALWFTTPNTLLDDRMPLDVIAQDPQAVFQAARVDRFIARG